MWDSYVYQKGVLCFLIHKSYVRSFKRYCFVRKYAAIPVQLEIFILQYIGWCVLIIWTFIINQFSCFFFFFLLLLLLCHRVIISITANTTTTFMQGIYNYIPEMNHDSRV